MYVIKERCRFSQINFFIEYSHIGPRFCFFPSNFMSSANTVKNYPFLMVHEQAETREQPFPDCQLNENEEKAEMAN